MNFVAFGVLSIIGAVGFVALYCLSYGGRRLMAWARRTPPPAERVGVFAVLALVVGFGLGSLVQARWNDLQPCYDTGSSIATCLLTMKR